MAIGSCALVTARVAAITNAAMSPLRMAVYEPAFFNCASIAAISFIRSA